MARFCIYCGREDTTTNPVINGVCLECRIKRDELVMLEKNELWVEFCKVCGSVKIGYKWIETSGFEEAIGYIINSVVPIIIKQGSGASNIQIDSYELVTSASWRTIVRV
ncbi:MAG: hypothetical protein J7L82_06405, partial [Staphylothermus sp.]|nr:hypothetical protein [Staphylothermus sp.]